MKISIILLFFLPLASRAQIIVDTALLNNSDKWKPKTSMAVIANILKKVSVGPFETVQIEKGTKRVTRSKNQAFIVENEKWGFTQDYYIEKRQPFDITAVFDKKDTILINIQMVTSTSGRRNGIIHSKNELPEYATNSIFCQEALIESKRDSTQWLLKRDTLSVKHFDDMCYIPGSISDGYKDVHIWRLFSSTGDTISIYPAKGFMKRVYKASLPEGIVFIRNGKQIAAYQIAPKYLWLRKDLKEQDKQILGACTVAILSDYRNEVY